MTLLPQANARLVSVGRGGYTEDYDRPSGGSNTLWTGNIDAYVQRKIVSGFNETGELNRVLQTTLIVTDDLSGVIQGGLQAGDIVTCSVGNPTSPTTLVARIKNITDPAYLAMLPDYFKCALEEVQAQ